MQFSKVMLLCRLLLFIYISLWSFLSLGAPLTSDESDALQVVGKQSVLQEFQQHQEHLSHVGVGLFYGAQSSYSPLAKGNTVWSDHMRFNFIKKSLRQEFLTTLRSHDSIDSYVNSLVGNQDAVERQGDIRLLDSFFWALLHIKTSYKSIGKEHRALYIENKVLKSKRPALTLALELQKDGWHSIYWNPDTQYCRISDPQQRRTAFSGLKQVQQGYYLHPQIKVDLKMINYNPPSSCKTKKQKSDMTLRLKRIPFWLGLYKGGHDVFTGTQGEINIIDSKEMPTSKTLIKRAHFETWQTVDSQGTHEGLILVPPGSI